MNSTANPVIFYYVENIGWLCLCTELSLENLMLLSRKSCKAKPDTCKHLIFQKVFVTETPLTLTGLES